MKQMLSLLAVAGFALGIGACSTVEGAGKDIEDTGEWVQEKADDELE